MEKTVVSKNQMINDLMKVGHGNLNIYLDVGLKAVKHEPELFAHMIAWNAVKGEVRDSKAALPIIAFRGSIDKELYENAMAHLCLLDPRNLVKAVKFHKELSKNKYTVNKHIRKLVNENIKKYVKIREQNRNWWNRTVIQHKKSMKALYAYYHIKPSQYAQKVLFDNLKPKGSIFEALKNLKHMDPKEVAGTILNLEIPYNIAVGALPNIKGNVDILLALTERMSGNELITNTNMLKNYGVFDNIILKSAYDSAIKRMRKDKRVSSLKASRAKETVTDKKAKAKLEVIQKQQLDKLGGIEGDWLVLGDKSGSMNRAIEAARKVSSLIAEQVKGNTHLIFFNTSPTYFDVSNMGYDEIKDTTKRQYPSGGTSIGVGLDYIMQKNIVVNGIVICSDGGENNYPVFSKTYKEYVLKNGLEPTVYFFRLKGDPDRLSTFCKDAGINLQTFDIDKDVDFYSLPNLIKTMKTCKYSLIDEIMEVPLLTLKNVFKKDKPELKIRKTERR